MKKMYKNVNGNRKMIKTFFNEKIVISPVKNTKTVFSGRPCFFKAAVRIPTASSIHDTIPGKLFMTIF